jgi:uncharacterized membrane protein YeaQ/YmgE (transglycosylase-associated protein family)
MRHEDLGSLYFWACLIGGPALVLVGARAAGLAVIGSLIGAFTSVMIVTEYDRIFTASMVGASVGAFVGGVPALWWRPRVSREVLLAVALIVACTGSFALFALPWPRWVIRPLRLDAALVLTLIVAQALQARPYTEAEAPGTTEPSSALTRR